MLEIQSSNMYVHLYSRGEDLFKEKVNVDAACQLMELQVTVEEEEDNFIGFTHPSSDDALIQFVRMKKDEWIFDIPLYKSDDYVGSLVTEINHSLALTITTEFFHPTPFQDAIIASDPDLIQKICRERWSLGFNLIPPDQME